AISAESPAATAPSVGKKPTRPPNWPKPPVSPFARQDRSTPFGGPHMRYIVSLFVACGSILAFAPAARADQVDNPLFQIWSKFNVGSSETFTTSMASGGMQMQFEAQHVLAEKASDHVTIT